MESLLGDEDDEVIERITLCSSPTLSSSNIDSAVSGDSTFPPKKTYGSKRRSFKINDSGNFMGDDYHEIGSNFLLNTIMGRSNSQKNQKSFYNEKDVIICGYLYKKGSWMKTWKKRYFVLRNDNLSLCYYASKTDLTLLGTIQIHKDSKVDICDIDSEKDILVLNEDNDKRLMLKVDDPAELDEWRSEISLIILHLNGDPSLSLKHKRESTWAKIFELCPTISNIEDDAPAKHIMALGLFKHDNHDRGHEDSNPNQAFKGVKKPIVEPPIHPDEIKKLINKTEQSIGGRKIVVHVSNVCKEHDMVFIAVFGSIRPPDNEDCSHWQLLYHTEACTVNIEDDFKGKGGIIEDGLLCFTLMLGILPKHYRNIRFELRRKGSHEEGEAKELDNFQYLISSAVILHDDLEMFNVTKVVMNSHIKTTSLSQKIKIPSVTLGLICVQSPNLYAHRCKMEKVIDMKPYAEMTYTFGSKADNSVSLEQLYASEYGLLVSVAVCQFFCQVRSSSIHNELTVCKQKLRNVEKERDIISGDSSNAMISLVEMSTSMIEAIASIDRLKKAVNDLTGIFDDLVSTKIDVFENSSSCMDGIINENVIDVEVGGNFLRRSVWKKDSCWQYCTTNLNMHIMTSDFFNNLEIRERRSIEISRPLHIIPTITFGCPSAHALKYKDGGLRRYFSGIANFERRLLFLVCIQASSDDKDTDDLLKKFPKCTRSIFGSSLIKSFTSNDTLKYSHYITKKYDIAKRLDICTSQILGFALCSIRTLCLLALLEKGKYFDALCRFLKVGMLLPIESMLSTMGDELGMLEDLEVSSDWLNLVTIRLVQDSSVARKGANNGLNILMDKTKRIIVDLKVSDEEGKLLSEACQVMSNFEIVNPSMKNRSLEEGCLLWPAIQFNPNPEIISEDDIKQPMKVYATFPLIGVVFSQGVNEFQSMANMSNSSDVKIQTEINASSFRRLKDYFTNYSAAVTYQYQSKAEDALKIGMVTIGTKYENDGRFFLEDLKTKMANAAEAIMKSSLEPREKHIHVLICTNELCRSMGAIPGILCKSGKDRTSMGVTLDVAKILVEECGVLNGVHALDVMRHHGVRRMNVFANTKQSLYAFNDIQKSCLPACFRPPTGTHSGNVQT